MGGGLPPSESCAAGRLSRQLHFGPGAAGGHGDACEPGICWLPMSQASTFQGWCFSRPNPPDTPQDATIPQWFSPTTTSPSPAPPCFLSKHIMDLNMNAVKEKNY